MQYYRRHVCPGHNAVSDCHSVIDILNLLAGWNDRLSGTSLLARQASARRRTPSRSMAAVFDLRVMSTAKVRQDLKDLPA